MTTIVRSRRRSFVAILSSIVAVASFGSWVSGSGDPDAEPATARYSRKPPSPDGIGKVYMGREISFVLGHRGARWLERPERARDERPDRVVEALALEPDDVVVDLGAGTGYFTVRLARRVPEGRVLAVDVQREMLRRIERRAARLGIERVETVLGAPDDPKLAASSVDVVLMVDAYHEFEYPWEMMRAVVRALRPSGRVVLVEYRAEDPDLDVLPLHAMTEAQVRREMEAVGLEFVENRSFLPTQHFLVFRKPAGGGRVRAPRGRNPTRRAGSPSTSACASPSLSVRRVPGQSSADSWPHASITLTR